MVLCPFGKSLPNPFEMTRQLYIPLLAVILIFSCERSEPDTFKSVQLEADKVISFDENASFIRLTATEVLSIDHENDQVLLGMPNQVRALPDGTFLVFDAATVKIHHFDQAGNYQQSFGSVGDGPGEFSAEAIVHVHLHEVYVFERMAYKIERFSFRDTKWIHKESISLNKINDDIPWGLLKADEQYLWLQYRRLLENENGAMDAMHHVTTINRSDSTTNTELAILPNGKSIYEDLGGFIASYPSPYSPRPIVGITSENDIILARTDAFSFLRIPHKQGNPVISSSFPVENLKLTRQERENFSGYAERIHNLVRDNMPETRPAVVGRVVSDDKNGFWVGFQVLSQSENRWMYIDHEGQITHDVLLPEYFTPHSFSGNRFYGISTVFDGSRSVEVFSLDEVPG